MNGWSPGMLALLVVIQLATIMIGMGQQVDMVRVVVPEIGLAMAIAALGVLVPVVVGTIYSYRLARR